VKRLQLRQRKKRKNKVGRKEQGGYAGFETEVTEGLKDLARPINDSFAYYSTVMAQGRFVNLNVFSSAEQRKMGIDFIGQDLPRVFDRKSYVRFSGRIH